MDQEHIRDLLQQVREGKKDVDEALAYLKSLPYSDLGFAKLDNHRSLRKGFPEVIFCQGKATEHVIAILNKMSESTNNILATRADKQLWAAVKGAVPGAEYNELARTIVIRRSNDVSGKGKILIVTAGTADLPVAEEAYVTAEIMGNSVERLYDVGVAGIHRLLDNVDILQQARVIVVAAGMEGALASVIGGLVDKPVIAVPTSVGYGASFNGLAALLSMLNSCASGMAVVNIDNGFGAGFMASVINRLD